MKANKGYLPYIIYTLICSAIGIGIGSAIKHSVVKSGIIEKAITYTEKSHPEEQQNTPVDRDSLPEIIRREFSLGETIYHEKGQEIVKLHMKPVILVPRDSYVTIRNTPRYASSQTDFGSYIVEDPIVQELTMSLLRADQKNFTYMANGVMPDYDRILQFIRMNIKPLRDPNLGYAKHPLETLVEGEGDCEDFTRLAATMISYTGRDLAVIYEVDPIAAHVALAIALRDGEKNPEYHSRTYAKKSAEEYNCLPIEKRAEDQCELLTKDLVSQTFSLGGKTYFAVEVVDPNVFSIKVGPLLPDGKTVKVVPIN